MSNKAINHVLDNSKTQSSARLLMVVIADMANDDGDCDPGTARLSQKVNCNERNVQKLVDRCETMGELAVIENGGRKTISGWTNKYVVLGLRYKTWQEVPGARQPRQLDNQEASKKTPLDIDGVSKKTPDGVSKKTPKPLAKPLENKYSDETEKPSVGEPKKERKSKKRNPMVDSVIEWLFEKEYDQCTKADKDYAGIIAAWLQGSYKPPNINIDMNPFPATPEDIRAIGEAYRRECPDREQYKPLKSLITISKRWLAMVKERQSTVIQQQQKTTDAARSQKQAMDYLRMVQGADDEPAAA